MESLDNIYNELIMEHSMNSYNKKKLEHADFCEIGHNPNCGDEITLELNVKDGKIEDMAFSGHGCAISQASTSIMIDTLKGKTLEEAKEIIKAFIGMIKREITDEAVRGLRLDFMVALRSNYLIFQLPTSNFQLPYKLQFERIINK